MGTRVGREYEGLVTEGGINIVDGRVREMKDRDTQRAMSVLSHGLLRRR